jgi:hypothetical protein
MYPVATTKVNSNELAEVVDFSAVVGAKSEPFNEVISGSPVNDA